MYTIPAFGPWPEQTAGPDEEKRLNSAQQSKTSPTSIDREHETGVFYGSGKLPYQTSLAACTGTSPQNEMCKKSTLAVKDAISAYLTRLFDTKPTIFGFNCPKEVFLRTTQSFSPRGGWLPLLPMVPGSCSTG